MSAVLDAKPSPSVAWLPWLAVIAGLLVLYAPTIFHLYRNLWNEEAYAHGPIVLGIVLWLFWRAGLKSAQHRAIEVRAHGRDTGRRAGARFEHLDQRNFGLPGPSGIPRGARWGDGKSGGGAPVGQRVLLVNYLAQPSKDRSLHVSEKGDEVNDFHRLSRDQSGGWNSEHSCQHIVRNERDENDRDR